MKNLIDRIIEIDHTADERLREAQHRKEQAFREIDAHKNEIMKEITLHGDNHLTDLEQTESAAAKKQRDMLDDNLKIRKEKLKETFDSQREAWAGELVNRILSR